ncbi:MAG: hypothetical protein ACLQVL_35570 [Terriglobia bacterium]
MDTSRVNGIEFPPARHAALANTVWRREASQGHPVAVRKVSYWDTDRHAVCLPELDQSEEMALRSEDKLWIKGEIQEALRPHGWRKAAHWLREWGLVAVVITAILALVAVVVTLAIYASNHLEQNARFQKGTEDFQKSMEDFKGESSKRLEKIEEAINTIQASQSLRQLSELKPKELAGALPSLRKVA